MKYGMAFFVLFAGAGLDGFASAANLVQNPDFDTDASGWSVQTVGTASASALAVDGSPAAGSVELTATGNGLDNSSVSIEQCITVIGPGPWVLGGRIRQITPATDFIIGLSVDFLAMPNCGAGQTVFTYATAGAAVPGVQGTYTQYSGSVLTDPMPGGGPTRSVLIAFRLDAGVVSTSTFRLDHVYFGPQGTTPVDLTRFEVQ